VYIRNYSYILNTSCATSQDKIHIIVGFAYFWFLVVFPAPARPHFFPGTNIKTAILEAKEERRYASFLETT
jgi:hypothetical protein